MFPELAVSYARFSSDSQDIKSADDQDIENKIYASNHNMKIIEFFRDEAKTGRKTVSRDGFFNMLYYCRKYNKSSKNINKIKYVLVWKFNRFARNDYDSTYYKSEFKKLGIRVLSITQPIQDTPEGHLLEGIIQNVDAYYSENLASDVRRGLRNNAKQKKFNGGLAPLGYKIENQKYVINEDEAKIVKEIFDLYVNKGKGLMDIAIEMNKKGYKTRLHRPFKQTSIYDILRNNTYIGTYTFKIEKTEEFYEYEDAIPQIIDKEVFNKVKEISSRNSKHKGTYSAKENYYLSGLIVCKECGRNYVGTKTTRRKNGKTYTYRKYKCNGRNKMYGCKNEIINADALENFVLKVLKEKLTNKDNLSAILTEIETVYNSFRENVVDTYNDTIKELNRIETKLGNYMRAIEDGLYTSHMKEEIEALESRKSYLKELLLDANTRKEQKHFDGIELLNMFKANLDNYENMEAHEKKNLFKTYIRKIEVNHKEITIYFNLSCLNDYELSKSEMVEVTGIEPATSWSQTTRATNCATPRYIIVYF